MRFFLTRHRLLAALAAIFALAIAIRAPFNGNVGVDEAYYLVIGRQWLHGVPLYAGTYDVKPPLLFLLMAGAEALFGPTLLAAKALTTASVAITAFGLYLLGRRIAGELVQTAARSHPHARSRRHANFRPVSCTRFKSLLVRLIRGKSWKRQPQTGQDFPRGVLAGGAAALLYIFSTLNLGGTLSPAELIMAPFTTFGMLMGLAALSNDGSQRIYSLLAAGLLFGAAACIKQTALFEAVAVAPLLAWSCRANLLQACGAFAAGCCAVPAGFALYFGAIGHLSDLFDMAAISALRRTSASFAPAWSEAVRRMAIEALQILPAVILAACFWASRRAPGDRAGYGSAPLAAWTLGTLAGLLSARAMIHFYALTVLQPLCLAAGLFASQILGRFENPVRRWVWRAVAIGFSIYFSIWSAATLYLPSGGSLRAAEAAASAMRRADLRPGERIFVADRDLLVYLAAGADPAGRIFHPLQLLCDFPLPGADTAFADFPQPRSRFYRRCRSSSPPELRARGAPRCAAGAASPRLLPAGPLRRYRHQRKARRLYRVCAKEADRRRGSTRLPGMRKTAPPPKTYGPGETRPLFNF